MKIKKVYKLLLFATAILLLYGCAEDLDFGQLEDAVLTPVFEVDFVFSEFNVQDNIPPFVPSNVDFDLPPNFLRDTINFDLVGSDSVTGNLDRIELTIEVRNTIERSFIIEFQFLNGEDQPLGQIYNVPIQAGLGSGTEPIVSFSNPDPIVLDNAAISELSTSEKVSIQIIAPTLNTDLRGILSIRSKASYFVNFEL